MIQNPNFFGVIEDQTAVAKAAHDVGALALASVYPIALGLLIAADLSVLFRSLSQTEQRKLFNMIADVVQIGPWKPRPRQAATVAMTPSGSPATNTPSVAVGSAAATTLPSGAAVVKADVKAEAPSAYVCEYL